MSSKNRHRSQENVALKSTSPRFSLPSRNKKWLASGIVLVILGFWILTFTDPAGQNWASSLSPLLLVVGYVLIGIGLVIPLPPGSTSNS